MAKHPILTPIRSSALDGFHYDAQTHKLTVRVKGSGKVYEYDDVALERAEAFAGNLSKGRYWNDQIKPFHIGREVM